METVYLPQAIFGEDFKNVYEPAEDTYLLLDALESDLNELKKNVLIGIECGSGSGAVITSLSKALSSDNPSPRLLFATDINEHACQTTRKCTTFHSQSNVEVIRTNLAQCLVDRLQHKVDILIFNPPYVPTEENELECKSGNQINLSWAGGLHGRQLIDKFLFLFVPRLLNKPDGVAYLVALDKNNISELLSCLVPEYGIQGSIVLQRKAGIESLYIIRYNWIC